MDLERLPGNEYRNIGPCSTGDGQLVQDLDLIPFRDAFGPGLGSKGTTGLAFKYSRPVVVPDNLSVEVGQHERLVPVL